jgi:hypothetical protein
MEKLDTLHFKEFNQEQRGLTCSIINRFGSGGHPVADEENLDGFTVSYLKEILNKKKFKDSIGNLSELSKKTLTEIEAKL